MFLGLAVATFLRTDLYKNWWNPPEEIIAITAKPAATAAASSSVPASANDKVKHAAINRLRINTSVSTPVLVV